MGQELQGPAGRAAFQWPHEDVWGSHCHSCLPPWVPWGFLDDWPLLRVGNPMAVGGVNENVAESKTLSGPSSSFLAVCKEKGSVTGPKPSCFVDLLNGERKRHI